MKLGIGGLTSPNANHFGVNENNFGQLICNILESLRISLG